MPIHPSQAARFSLLEGIESFEQGLADPVTRARLDEFMSITGTPQPPEVGPREDSAPGPYGPVPVRIYSPSDGGSPGRPSYDCTAGRSARETSTCRRRTGPLVRSASGPARGEPIHGLPRPDQDVAEALIGLHHRTRDVFRAAGLRTGMTLIGRENIAEEGGEEPMREERAAFEDQFLEAAAGDDWIGQQIYTCARFGPDGLIPPRRSCIRWPTAWNAVPRRAAPPCAGPRRCSPVSRSWSLRTGPRPPTTRTASGSPPRPCRGWPG